MRKFRERPNDRLFRGGELSRLATMLVMLGVLWMMIQRARDEQSWRWLANDPEVQAAQVAEKPAGETTGDAKPAAPAEVLVPGPTDEDSEELEGAQYEFQALTDATLGMQREEMPSYWRLFRWVQAQDTKTLRKRARTDLVVNHFLQRPEEHRGQLVEIDLHVTRVLPYAADKNSAGIKTVYEIWGWTEEGKVWIYSCLTADLPAGMPVGPQVEYQAKFVGYFLKLQGYHNAGAKPNAPPLKAPLLIGRVIWRAPKTVAMDDAGNTLNIIMIGAAVFLIFAGLFAWRYLPRNRTVYSFEAHEQQRKEAKVGDWLEHATVGEVDDVDSPPDSDSVRDGADRR